jgi:hypothetical protein
MNIDEYFDGDYRQWDWVKHSCQYYEVTKEGLIVKHEDRSWNQPNAYTINQKGNLIKVSV